MGEGIRPYSPQPVEMQASEEMDPNDFGFKLVEVEVNRRKKGMDQFSFSIPQRVRSLHYRDVIFGAEWKSLLAEFDERLLVEW